MYIEPFIYKGGACSSSRNGHKIEYIVIHWTANTSKNANAEMHDKFYRNCNNGVSSHYTIDDKYIIQSVGDSRAAWTVGNSTKGLVNVGLEDAFTGIITNQNSLNIELCVNSGGNWKQTFDNAVEFTKNLMKYHKIDSKHVVRHHDAQRINNSGTLWRKDCPGNMKANNWAEWKKFKQLIKEAIKIEWDVTKSSNGKLAGGKDVSIPTENITGTPIKNDPTADIETMRKWARRKNASQTFIDLAETFYNVGKKYNIDPAVVYAQSAKETGFMKFGGVLDATFHNPCGLKTTTGGGNNDPNAHKKFDNWEQGITAQVQHLGLYAGEIYKDGDIVDPRHFPEIRGKAKTVEELGGKWAPSGTYGNEIVNMMKEFSKTQVKEEKKDIEDLKNFDVIISLMSEADIPAARELSSAANGAITFSGDVDYYPLKKAGKKIIAVGGTKANHSSYIDMIIAGDTAEDTKKKVEKFIKGEL